jgi:urea carboxylase
MPVILTVDGPSLGGFVCPATIPSSELWKVGQLRPHDSISFKAISIGDAYEAALRTDALVAAVKAVARGKTDAASAAASLDSLVVGAGPGWRPAGGGACQLDGGLAASALLLLLPCWQS